MSFSGRMLGAIGCIFGALHQAIKIGWLPPPKVVPDDVQMFGVVSIVLWGVFAVGFLMGIIE